MEQPLGEVVLAWTRRTDLLASMSDEQLLATAWRTRSDVRQETLGPPGAADPEVIVLRQQRGMRRARRVDTVEAALVGASDGDLTATQVLGAVAELLDQPVDALLSTRLGALRELVTDGFLEP